MRRLGFPFLIPYSLLFVVACTPADIGTSQSTSPGAANTSEAIADPLPSWNDGVAKREIVGFVDAVTDASSPDFVAPEDRIATFDNDGTMWNEKPLYIHIFAVFGRFNELMEADASLADKEPYKAVATKDLDFFMDLAEQGEFLEVVGDLMGLPFAGMSPAEFAEWNENWLASWKHPKYKVGYRDLIYQPMVEVFDYLRANDFEIYLCTADEAAFLRLVSEELYGVPPQNVLGSSVKLEYKGEADPPSVLRTGSGNYLNNWDGKPRHITQTIGRQPILAGGNSNGDLHMLQWVGGAKGKTLAILVHHTDGDREDQYDKHTDKVMPLAKEGGWTIVDMTNDWKTVFPR